MEKVLNSYESVIVVDLANGEEAAKAVADKFTALISENAELVEVNVWGKRRLAYPINDKPDGYYVISTFKSEAAFPAEFERLLNIDEAILRSMVIRMDHEAVATKVEPAEVPAEATEANEVAAEAAETVESAE